MNYDPQKGAKALVTKAFPQRETPGVKKCGAQKFNELSEVTSIQLSVKSRCSASTEEARGL